MGALQEVGLGPQVSAPQSSPSFPSVPPSLQVAVLGAPRSSLGANPEQGWAESRRRDPERDYPASQPHVLEAGEWAEPGCGRGLPHVTLRGLLIRWSLLAGVLVLRRRLCAQACRPRNCTKVTAARRLSIHHPLIHSSISLSSVCPSLAPRSLPSRPSRPAP